METTALLPPGFSELEPFIDYWDRPDSHQRWAQRQAATAEQLRKFYDVHLTHAERAIEYLKGKRLDALDEPDARLMRLMLALMHASIGVELHNQPTVPHAPYPHRVRIDRFTTTFT